MAVASIIFCVFAVALCAFALFDMVVGLNLCWTMSTASLQNRIVLHYLSEMEKEKNTPRMSKCSIVNIYQTKLKLPNWSDIVAIFAMPTEAKCWALENPAFSFHLFCTLNCREKKVMAFLQKRTIFHIYICYLYYLKWNNPKAGSVVTLCIAPWSSLWLLSLLLLLFGWWVLCVFEWHKYKAAISLNLVSEFELVYHNLAVSQHRTRCARTPKHRF